MIHVNSGKRGKYDNAKTGKFLPLHPEKYHGMTAPIYKSSLELRCMQYLDKNPNILRWTYEPKSIKYLDKSSSPPKIRRYYIDFTVIAKTQFSQKQLWLEVKPYSEVIQPKNTKNIKANLLYIKNQCKWTAAKQMAKQCGAEFIILTEKELN